MKQHIVEHTPVPRETFKEIDHLIYARQHLLNAYLDQLLWWNQRVNLVSRDVPRETIREHIRHSLLLTQLNVYKSSNYIVDTGSGGGLPGIPLAIASTSKSILLNDVVKKKASALKQIVRKIGLSRVEVRDGSVSELQVNAPFLLISKHAFKISELLELTKDLPWSAMVFYKGTDFENELKDIEMRLHIIVYDLYTKSKERFYEGKSIIEVTRI